MIPILVDSWRWRARKWTKKLGKLLPLLIEKHPDFAKHLEGLKNITLTDHIKFCDNRKACAYYQPGTYEIRIAVYDIDDRFNDFLYVLLHEIGHHVMHKKYGIDRGYDFVRRNAPYYREEIRADGYARDMIRRLFLKTEWPNHFWLDYDLYTTRFVRRADDLKEKLAESYQKLRSLTRPIFKQPTFNQFSIMRTNWSNNWAMGSNKFTANQYTTTRVTFTSGNTWVQFSNISVQANFTNTNTLGSTINATKGANIWIQS